MPAPANGNGRWTALAAPALVLLWLAMLLLGSGDGLDRALLQAVYVGDRPRLATAALWLTRLGDAATLLALSAGGALFLAWRRRPRAAMALLAGTLLGRLLVDLQKVQIGRLRPEAEPQLVVVHNLSFPSGHSANSMLVYVSLALLLAPSRRARLGWALAAALLSLAIGVSRVMLGVHWPSDVAGGWAFGLLWVAVVLRLNRREKFRQSNELNGR